MRKSIRLAGLLLMLTLVVEQIAAEPRIKFKRVIRQGDGQFSLENDAEQNQDPRILIAVTVKDNQYSLPTFLATLETLECPNKEKKCDLWIVFDDCQDKSYDMFTNWLTSKRPIFDSILMIDTKNDQKTKQNHPELGDEYFSRNLKIRALAYAIEKKLDYIFFLKADVVLTNPKTLEILISKKKSIVAPLLTSSDSTYSTFWHEGPPEVFERLFMPTYTRKTLGCSQVYGVQDCFLVDLLDQRFKNFLVKNSIADADFQFSAIARSENVIMHVCNREIFGYIPDSIPDREASFTHLRIEHLLKGPNKTYNQPLPVSKHIDYSTFGTTKSKLGFDQIYVINLERRQDRRERIHSTLDDLGIEYKLFKAIDGSQLDDNYIKSLGIRSVPNYKDPYSGRGMNFGEIGCFLSHYFIWEEVVERGYKRVLILEDDAKFALNFKAILTYLIQKTENNNVSWDLLYLGRKQMKEHSSQEFWEKNVPTINGYGIVHPAYTHWTVAYAVTLEGAQKLLKPEPLKKLLPVDEYIPVMYDRQPNEQWSSFFPERDLKVLAIYPSIVMPTHFTGDPNYVSDTEFTPILKEDENLSIKIDIDQSEGRDENLDFSSRIEL